MYRERVIYMAIKVGMVSLGCAKNQVDGEMVMASLKNAGFELCDDAALADVAIVHTCATATNFTKSCPRWTACSASARTRTLRRALKVQ